ncbi:MAG: redoxin family protein [Flavobacteriales bacterium]
MKKLRFLLLFLVSAATLNAQLKLGDKALMLDDQLQSTLGETTSLNDSKKENGLLVVFSCNTCPFVVGTEDFPGWERQYNSLYDFADSLHVGMILVNSNEGKRQGTDSYDEMKKHAAELQYKMAYVVDVNSTMANIFGAKTTPHVFLLDGDMNLVYMGSIDNIWDKERKADIPYVKQAMKDLAAKKRIKTNSTPPKGCGIKRVTN